MAPARRMSRRQALPPCSVTAAVPFHTLAADRHSVRAYLPDRVEDEVLRSLLATARLAPSSSNLQPGMFTLVRGEVREQLSRELIERWRAGGHEIDEYDHFPRPMPMALRRRQVASAKALYDALGIARDDRAGRDAQFERNFRFFDAPVALVVTIDRQFGSAGYADLGMAIYGLMLAAQSKGLGTCAIGAIAPYPSVIRRHLGLDETSIIVCGMALGYADPDAPANQARTTRCSLDEFVRVVG